MQYCLGSIEYRLLCLDQRTLLVREVLLQKVHYERSNTLTLLQAKSSAHYTAISEALNDQKSTYIDLVSSYLPELGALAGESLEVQRKDAVETTLRAISNTEPIVGSFADVLDSLSGLDDLATSLQSQLDEQ